MISLFCWSVQKGGLQESTWPHSPQNKEDKHVFIESFRGSNRYIVGLLGEVLANLPRK